MNCYSLYCNTQGVAEFNRQTQRRDSKQHGGDESPPKHHQPHLVEENCDHSSRREDDEPDEEFDPTNAETISDVVVVKKLTRIQISQSFVEN
ncbi:hypothetical protein TNCV_3284761 [Trichonephila clavipes]|nr:hypothetical protein TNCV_3284761 [Trichonephila clavipes]